MRIGLRRFQREVARPNGHAIQHAPLAEQVKEAIGEELRAARGAGRGHRGHRDRRAREGAAGTIGAARERWRRCARTEAGLPRTVVRRRRAPRATRTAGFEHAVVMAMAVVPEDHGAGEEYDRQDENDPGDNHHPRRGRIEPRWLGPWGRRGRGNRGDGSRLGRRFGCFAHALNIAQAYNRRNTFRQQTCCESRRESSVLE
jgi:hypothetical protein